MHDEPIISRYVNGFLFDQSRSMVALINKNKPAWQVGKLNGIGGKIEQGETAAIAMIREFKEETGLCSREHEIIWKPFATMSGEQFSMQLFKAFTSVPILREIRTTTDEQVGLFNVCWANSMESFVIHNLRYLIPLALDDRSYGNIYIT